MPNSSLAVPATRGKGAPSAAMPSIRGAASDEMLHHYVRGSGRASRDLAAPVPPRPVLSPREARSDRLPGGRVADQAFHRSRLRAAQRRRRAARRGAGRQKPSKRFIVLAACMLVMAAVEGFFAYRSSQTPWVFDSPDAQKHHLLRNSWTGEYSYGK